MSTSDLDTDSAPAATAPRGLPVQHAQPAARTRRLGQVLVDAGLLTVDLLREALDAQHRQHPGARRRRLGELMVEQGLLTTSALARGLAERHGLRVVDLTQVELDTEAVRLLPQAVSERYGALVLAADGGRVTVAVTDPTDVVALDDIRMHTRAQVLDVLVAAEDALADALRRAWSLSSGSSDVTPLFDGGEVDPDDEPYTDDATSDAPAVRLLGRVLNDAVRERASDVHVEPHRDGLRIRYRVDGLLRDVLQLPRSAAPGLVSRIKVTSGLDIAERRRPQDGRVRLRVDGRVHDARVSTLPSVHGEKVVVRLLPGADTLPSLDQLGMDAEQQAAFLTALRAPSGLVLVTGPTGSGKTSTLHAGLAELATPERNVVTLEDPVEVQVPGVTQVQVAEKAGLTFSSGLRAVLRQDPDVVLVGEVRDAETAELALKASLTGHLVLATLHTNDAAGAVTRLVDMGVDPYLVAGALTLVVGQRLVRRPCATCAGPSEPPVETLDLLGLSPDDLAGATPRRGSGCSDCGGSGYRGRRGVFELLPVTRPVRAALLDDRRDVRLTQVLVDAGHRSLRTAGVAAALRGETTLDEVLRTTPGDGDTDRRRCASCERWRDGAMPVCPWCTADADPACTECRRPLEDGWVRCPWCRTPRSSSG